MRRRIPGPGRNIQQFVICLVLHVLLPLLPLAFEFARFRYLRAETATLAATIYVMGIGVSSRNEAQFGLGVTGSVAYAFTFGWMAGRADITESTLWFALVGIGLAAFLHSAERWNRHVIEGSDFLQFSRGE